MRRTNNSALFRAIAADAETLSGNIARHGFPVLLRPIAERRRVTNVEFRPLLVDAMLTTHSDGFRILFNSGEAGPATLKEQYEHEVPEALLPPRLRFSLAHELAHTLFYDLSGSVPRVAERFRSGGGRTELENLELNCNRIAARMLLPGGMLKAALLRLRPISPQGLIQLARQAGVSVECLVRRLSDQGSLLTDASFRGCIVLVEQSTAETKVVAVARPPMLNLARDLRLIRSGELWQVETCEGVSLNLRDMPPVSSVMLTVETSLAASQRYYQIAQGEAARSTATTFTVVTFEEREDS